MSQPHEPAGHRISPRRNFVLVACICIAEPFSSVLLLPFIYFMVRDMGYADADVGAHAGWITSAFFVVQIFSTPAWCALSDRVGRKPCMIFGLVGTAVSMVLFGLSSSLAWAMVTRAVCGAVNGNLAIARTVVGELAAATGVEKGRAFSLFGFCVATGWMLGPFIGGALADPSRNLGFHGPRGLFDDYPWLFPCLFSAVYNLVVGIASALYLDETVGLTIHNRASRPSRQPTRRDLERQPLLVNRSPSPGSETFVVGPEYFRNIQFLTLLSSVFYFIHIISFDELYALFAASSLADGIGLSFQSPQIALSLSFAGPAMIVALLLFPSLHRCFTSVPLYMCSGVAFVWVYPIFSLLPALANAVEESIAMWVVLECIIMLRYGAMVIGLASLQVLINDVVHPRQRAFINGLAQSVGSFARAIGPSLGGSVWTWSLKKKLEFPLDFHAMFLLLSLLGIAQVATIVAIPPQNEIDRAMEAWEREHEGV